MTRLAEDKTKPSEKMKCKFVRHLIKNEIKSTPCRFAEESRSMDIKTFHKVYCIPCLMGRQIELS